MNILILLKSFNYPPRNGGDQAVFNAINRLKDDVHFHLIGTDGSVKGIESMMAFQADNPSIPTRVYDLGKKDKYQRIKKKFNRISNYINNRNGNKTIVDMQLLDVYDAQLDYYYNFYINKIRQHSYLVQLLQYLHHYLYYSFSSQFLFLYPYYQENHHL